jgi:hypothetical protein
VLLVVVRAAVVVVVAVVPSPVPVVEARGVLGPREVAKLLRRPTPAVAVVEAAAVVDAAARVCVFGGRGELWCVCVCLCVW